MILQILGTGVYFGFGLVAVSSKGWVLVLLLDNKRGAGALKLYFRSLDWTPCINSPSAYWSAKLGELTSFEGFFFQSLSELLTVTILPSYDDLYDPFLLLAPLSISLLDLSLSFFLSFPLSPSNIDIVYWESVIFEF